MSLKEQLTPHKLSLLLLVKEYCLIRRRLRNPDPGAPQGPVFLRQGEPGVLPEPGAPPGDLQTDSAFPSETPSTETVVSFPVTDTPSSPDAHSMVEKCQPQPVSMETNGNHEVHLTEPEMTKFMVAILKLIQSSDVEPQELLGQVRGFCNEGLSQLFIDKLSEIHEGGLLEMMNFLQQINADFFSEPKPLVQKSSVIGLFVRRLSLCFQGLSFSQITSLFRAFNSYFSLVKPRDVKIPDDDVMDETMESSMCDVTLPDRDVTVLGRAVEYSERQAELLIMQQSLLLQYDQTKALPPKQLEKTVRELLAANPCLADAHYLSYLNRLRVSEYCLALDSLYHYFDRNQFKRPQDDDTGKGYRYAILNLATLHYRFGHRQEALQALREAVSVAQEYNDNVCVQHALSWASRLGQELPVSTRGLEKSSDQHLAYLTSLNAQLMARRVASEGLQPASVMNQLTSSDWLNCQHSLTELQEVSLAQKSALWTTYGNRFLPTLYSQMALQVSAQEHGIAVNLEPSLIAKCTIARALADQGHFQASQSVLTWCRPQGVTDPHRGVWDLSEAVIKFDQALHEGNTNQLQDLAARIKCLDEREGELRHALYLKEIGDTESAYNEISKLRALDLDNDPGLRCRVALAYSELCCQIGNPVLAIDSLLTCIVYCKDRHLAYYHCLASMHLAYVQFCVNIAGQALQLLDNVLATMFEVGSVYDIARCLCLYAKCKVSASREIQCPDQRRQVLVSVLNILHRAVSLYQRLNNSRRVKDVYYYQARLYHQLGLVSERNKFAIEFRKLDSLHPTLTQMAVNTL